MLKQQHIAIADTNLSNFSSELEKNIRQHAGEGEPAWKTAGKKTGLEGWRVKQFKLEKVPDNLLGQFYDGDSYIILKSVVAATGGSWDIYFWLGTNTSQDEAGTAAYKTVELDDHLNGAPVQHREVDGYESDRFISLFESKGGIRLLKGGFETGFQHVKPEEYKTRLLHVRGTTLKNVRVLEVPLQASSLNSSDVFIVDAGLKIYQFNGKNAKPAERNKGSVLANAIRDEREGGAEVLVIDEGDSDLGPFWQFFGGPQKIAEDAPAHIQAEQEHKKFLFKLSDSSGNLTFTKVGEGKLDKSVLDPKDVFILDAGFEVFAWVGQGASPNERKSALNFAAEYLKKQNRPNYLPITRLQQGGENEVFNAQFA
jgi:gelsolin